MPLARLVYISRSTIEPSQLDAELTRIHVKAQVNNRRVGVTGMLLFSGGNFLQLLEGDDVAVLHAFDRIGADPRHTGVERLIFQPIPERMFNDWDMAMLNVDLARPLDKRRFFALASACRNESSADQLTKLYAEFRGQMAGEPQAIPSAK